MSDVIRRRSTGLAGVLVAAALLLTLGSDPASGAFAMPEGGSKGDRTISRGGGDTTAPTKPTRLDITSVTGSTVTISWRKSNDNRGVAGYDLYRDDQRVAAGTATGHEYVGLRCGTSYRLGVEAFDAAGNRSERVTILGATAACTDTTPPSEPRNVAQVAVTSSSITLSWSASTDDFGVVEYEILRDGTPAGATAATLFSVSSLACGTMYTIGIRARDAAGNRSTIASVLMTTAACPDTTAPSAPGSLAVVSANETSVSVSWSGSSDDVGVLGYGVYRDGAAVGSTGSHSYIVADLRCGTSYAVAVDAYDAAGNRSTRSAITASTSACPPPNDPPSDDRMPPTAPTGVTVTGATAGSISLAWDPSTDNAGVTGYGLYRDGASVGSVSQPSATFSALACGRSYSLEVDAYDARGNRSARTAVVASTSPCPDTAPPSTPAGLTQTAASETTVAFGWTASTDNVGVAGYGVYLAGVRVGSVASPGYTFESLSCGTTYVVGVDAYDAAGSRSDQATLAITTRSCADTQAPSVPQDQTIAQPTRTSFAMSWSASTDNVGVAGYAVYLDGARVATTTQTSYSYTGLACGRTYTVGLEAFDAAGNASSRAQASGPATTAACAGEDTTAPSTPAGVAASGQTATAITLSWTASTDNVGVTGYGYYRNGALVGNGSGTSYSFGGLTCGTTYTLAVDAYDAAGNRSAKGSVSAATSACSPPPTGSPAALFVSPAGSDSGSCTAAQPCASFQRAYAVAAPGATVEVAGGTYPSQSFRAVPGKTGPNVVFRPAEGARVILGSLGFGSGSEAALGPDFITVRGMETTYKGSAPGAGNQRGIHVAPGSTYITLEDMDAGSISSWFADHLTVRGGDYGPCDAVTGSNVCSNNKQDLSTNVLIEGAYFHDLEYDPSAPDAHWECMYVNGSVNVTIRGNRFERCAIFDLFVTISGPDAGRVGHENLTIENNWFAPATNGLGSPSRGWSSLSVSWCQNSSQPAYRNVKIRNNSFGPGAGIQKDLNADGAGCTWQNVSVTGNIGAYGGCQNGWSYAHNLWVGSSKCNASDTNVATLPYFNPAGFDYHLAAGSSAEGFVPGAVCAATDFDGQPRAAPCDAGSDER